MMPKATNMNSVYDIFRSPYYKVNFFYWRILGLWPTGDFKMMKRIIVVVAIISLIIPQAIKLHEEWNNDFDLAIEIVGNIIYFIGSIIKYWNFLRVEKQMTFLFDKIANDWKSIKYKEELKKLEKYGLSNRHLTLGYIIPINIILVVYITLPLSPIPLDIIDPLNETRQRGFPNPVEYFIDDQKYYFLLNIHGCIGCILSVLIYGTFDTTYVCFVQHACALFAIVEIRMRRVVKIATYKKYATKWQRDEEEYRNTIAAIQLHKEAIRFIDEIGKSYSLVFLLVIALNSAVICITAVIILLSLENGNVKHATRFACLYIGYSFHLLYNMIPGQQVIDHSIDVQNAVYNCEWYKLSLKTRQLLRIMMLRSLKPCTFSGQKIIELNLENFATVFRKSISYVTLIGSMR